MKEGRRNEIGVVEEECGREKGRRSQCVKPLLCCVLLYRASKCIVYSQNTDSLLLSSILHRLCSMQLLCCLGYVCRREDLEILSCHITSEIDPYCCMYLCSM